MLKVGLLGHGAIGTQVATGLEAGKVPEAKLSGVFDPWVPHPKLAVSSMDELLATSDIIVEAAGHEALTSYGQQVRQSGADLLVVSVGALADEDLLRRLSDTQDTLRVSSAPVAASVSAIKCGRLFVSTGAIGGIDILRAAGLAGNFSEVEMISRKPSGNLPQAWMDEETKLALATGAEPVVVFEGTARQACGLFPQSANVCATLALATIGFDKTKVSLVGEPQRKRVRHEIKVKSDVGVYELAFENMTSPANPRTSAIVPWSVLRALGSLPRNLPVSKDQPQSPSRNPYPEITIC